MWAYSGGWGLPDCDIQCGCIHFDAFGLMHVLVVVWQTLHHKDIWLVPTKFPERCCLFDHSIYLCVCMYYSSVCSYMSVC